jgi:Mg-chelatase subunit ChlD
MARYSRDRSGSVGLLFGVVFMAVMMITAVAIDYGRTELEWQRIQRAADSAALAASHRLGTPDQDETGVAAAERFFRANTDNRTYEALQQVILDADKGEVRVVAGGTIATSLLNSVGVRNLGIRASSRVVKGNGTVEVALVLDNSGSMAGQPIADLMTAAKSLTGVLMVGSESSERVQIGVVPFSGAVNVGSGYRGADWIDSEGNSPVNGANFASNVPRFQMFDRIGASWRGCVEARTNGLDVTDAPADPSSPATLFVPMFAPDEPDDNNGGGASYQNNYIADDGGACTPQPVECVSYNRRGQCTKFQKLPLPTAEAQSRICKYDGAVVPMGDDGPNYMCNSEAILPLSSDQGEIEAKLSTMVAKGSTNIAEGVAWGWRVLSPAEPFAQGRSYDEPKNDKIMIVMTDGANTYSASSNHNKSWYAAHGYGSSGRLGTSYSSSSYVSRMNQKTAAACANAKAAGVKIYTIAFRLESDPATLSLLQSCASEASMAYRASDGTSLIAVFEQVGGQISRLRVAG